MEERKKFNISPFKIKGVNMSPKDARSKADENSES
jgi:hypothetical protein